MDGCIGLASRPAPRPAPRRAARPERAEWMQPLLDATFDGVALCRDGVVVEANQPFTRLLGTDRAALLGRPLDAALGFALPPGPGMAEVERTRPDGAAMTVEVQSRALPDGLTVVALRDIGERRRVERRLDYVTRHDGLTGLANRAQFHDQLTLLLARADAPGAGLVLLDLHGFKTINDSFGHAIGDALLRDAGARLAQAVRPSDMVARLGADEFAVLLPDVLRAPPLLAVAERLVRQFGQPFAVEGQRLRVAACAGVAVSPADGTTPQTLLRAAGTALAQAKADGPGASRSFEPMMEARTLDRRMLERDLRGAIGRGELAVHYQPQFLAGPLTLTGYEALLRWNHPERGPVSPAVFIPMAEQNGQIAEIGGWVLRTACAEAAGWPQPWRIAVNLSPVQFRQPDLAQEVLEIARDSGLDPARLELEVTEGVLIDDADRALAILRGLQSFGMRLALDDFGTGYSSLSYLRRFPFDALKIDKSFTQALGRDAGADAIVRMVVALGHSLGLDVTAEGVETKDQLRHLRDQGCGQVQGFLLGRPVPATVLRMAAEAGPLLALQD